MAARSGSGPFGADAQAAWLGQPSQAAALPASSLAVPGQSAGGWGRGWGCRTGARRGHSRPWLQAAAAAAARRGGLRSCETRAATLLLKQPSSSVAYSSVAYSQKQ